jgi:hypothetical protein
MMEPQPLFDDLVGVMTVIIMIPVFFLWLERKTRWKVFDFMPAIIWIFITPIFLSNLNVIPRSSEIYTTFRSFAVPLFIVLMLLDINIRQAMRVAWRGAAVMVLGAFGIVAGAVLSFFMFRSGLPEGTWMGYGALAGSWIGGTGNLAAVADSLNTPGEMVGMVVLVDNLVYVFYFPLILSCKRWAKQFNRFSKVPPEAEAHFTDAAQKVEKKSHEVHFRDALTLLGWGFVALAAATGLSFVFPEVPPVFTQRTWAILRAGHRAALDDLRVHLHDDDGCPGGPEEPGRRAVVHLRRLHLYRRSPAVHRGRRAVVPHRREHGGRLKRRRCGRCGLRAGGRRVPPRGAGAGVHHAGADRVCAGELPGGGHGVPVSPAGVMPRR